MRAGSIRRRLLAGVAVVQVLAAVLVTVLVVRHEQRRSYAMLEAQLEEHGAMVRAMIDPPDTAADQTILHRELLTLPKRDVYVLSDSLGTVIAASGDWRPSGNLSVNRRGFQDVLVNGRRYRAIVERDIPIVDGDPKLLAQLPRLRLVYGAPVSGVEEHVRHVMLAAVGLALLILAASLAAVSWVVSAGLRPVVRLAGQAAAIDSTHWDWEAVATETEELAPLSLALTRLVERLRAAFVRERQFSADAAHEMKTAVAIVKSTLQLALERGGDRCDYRAGLERALDDTGRIQGLVSGMLHLAKIEGLAWPAASETAGADVVQEVTAVAQRMASLLEAREMRLHIDIPETSARVRLTADSLNTVLTNLLENAMQHSPEASAIQVRCAVQGDACVVSIEDTGCGIPAATLPHIFERFYRGDVSRSRESGGAGLGLAIVQAIVHRAGGSITAASLPGVGSVFTLVLPVLISA